jgi:PAS domain S-box-containing protein
LISLARQVVAQLELRRKVAALERETSSRRVAEEQAAAGRERYWRVFHSALDGIVAVDHEGRITEFNPSAERLFGYPRDVAVGEPLADLLVPERYRAAFAAGLTAAIAGDAPELVDSRRQLNAVNAAGQEFPVEVTLTRGQRTPPTMIGFVRDLSERRGAERALRRSLASLAAIAENSPSAIYVKDHERRYVLANPETGRSVNCAADELLGQRDEDVLANGLAGRRQVEDERVLTSGEPVGADEVITVDGEPRTYRTIRFPLREPDGGIYAVCGISTDITERRQREEDERERESWSRRLRGAMRNGGFVLHGQPIVDVTTREVHKHELLLRMRGDRPDELIPPGEFLPQAERYGLIGEVDLWVVAEALTLARDRSVAINLSGASIGSTELLGLIHRVASAGAVDPRNVTFEVTETAAVGNLEAARRFVQSLTDVGFGFALDDFGTGFGSFTYLRYLPVTYLKIDMQFIRGLPESESDRQVVRSIISIARDFGIKTIAEGVENDRTLEILREDGADFAQGFGLARPGPLPDPV